MRRGLGRILRSRAATDALSRDSGQRRPAGERDEGAPSGWFDGGRRTFLMVVKVGSSGMRPVGGGGCTSVIQPFASTSSMSTNDWMVVCAGSRSTYLYMPLTTTMAAGSRSASGSV